MNKKQVLITWIMLCAFMTTDAQSWMQIGQDIDGQKFGEYLGYSVSMNDDGTIIAAGTPDGNSRTGLVRVYQNQAGDWVKIGQDINGEATSDNSGCSISLNGKGNIVAIGAKYNDDNGVSSGHVRVYENQDDTWIQIGQDINGDSAYDISGYSVSLSNDGTILAIGSPGSLNNIPATGHVSVYKYQEKNWVQIGENINGQINYEHSGYSVSLNTDGTIVAIGGSQGSGAKDVLRIYQNQNGSWQQLGQTIYAEVSADETGYSINLSGDGYTVAIGAPSYNIHTGQARIYHYQENSWSQVGDFIDGIGESDYFARSVSLNADGTIVAIGSLNNGDYPGNYGYVHIFQNQEGVWKQLSNSIAGEAASDIAYHSVCLSADGKIVAVGAPDNKDSHTRAGQVRAFKYMKSPITSQPSNQENMCIGSNTSFSVSGEESASYQWQVSTDSANTFNDLTDEGIYLNTSKSTLMIVGISTEINNNYYRCIVSTEHIDFFSDTISLTLDTVPPIITSSPPEQTLNGSTENKATLPDYTADVNVVDVCDTDLTITQNPAPGTTISGSTNTITLTATDDTGNSVSVSFNVEVLLSSGVYLTKNEGITMYPNPMKNILNLDFHDIDVQQIILFNVTGNILFMKNNIKSEEQLDLTGYKKGIYMLQIKSKGATSFCKIVKE